MCECGCTDASIASDFLSQTLLTSHNLGFKLFLQGFDKEQRKKYLRGHLAQPARERELKC